MICCCAVESPPDDADAAVPIAHETAHAAHTAANPKLMGAAGAIADALFVEGLAVVASMAGVPGTDVASALWVGRTSLPDGVAANDWLAECEASWRATNIPRNPTSIGGTFSAVATMPPFQSGAAISPASGCSRR
jgi:hypothetical protein